MTDQEGQKLGQIVRRGSTSSVRLRRAMMLLASAGGNRVSVIAKLVQADEDTVRDVIHRFNEIGLACLDPRWAGGRPSLLSPDDEDFVVATATTRPTKLGQPFTRWSIRKLAAYPRKVHGRVIRIGREALRCLLARHGVTFQRTKTWKESPDPDRDVKLDRIEEVLERFLDRVFAFDEYGPLGIRPTAGSCWAAQGHPERHPATLHRTHGVRYFHGCYSVGDDTLRGINRNRKDAADPWICVNGVTPAKTGTTCNSPRTMARKDGPGDSITDGRRGDMRIARFSRREMALWADRLGRLSAYAAKRPSNRPVATPAAYITKASRDCSVVSSAVNLGSPPRAAAVSRVTAYRPSLTWLIASMRAVESTL
jgi:transposase